MAHFVIGEAVAAESDTVQPDDSAGAAVDHDKRRDILNDMGLAANHCEAADAAELMNGDRAAQVRAFLDDRVSAEQHVVDDDGVVSDHRVMADMGVHHQQIVVANHRHAARVHRRMNRDRFAETVAVADSDATVDIADFGMLRFAANHRAFAHLVVPPHRHAAFHHDPGAQDTVVADPDAFFHNREGTDRHTIAEHSGRTDNSSGVDVGRHRSPLSFLGCG